MDDFHHSAASLGRCIRASVGAGVTTATEVPFARDPLPFDGKPSRKKPDGDVVGITVVDCFRPM